MLVLSEPFPKLPANLGAGANRLTIMQCVSNGASVTLQGDSILPLAQGSG